MKLTKVRIPSLSRKLNDELCGRLQRTSQAAGCFSGCAVTVLCCMCASVVVAGLQVACLDQVLGFANDLMGDRSRIFPKCMDVLMAIRCLIVVLPLAGGVIAAIAMISGSRGRIIHLMTFVYAVLVLGIVCLFVTCFAYGIRDMIANVYAWRTSVGLPEAFHAGR